MPVRRQVFHRILRRIPHKLFGRFPASLALNARYNDTISSAVSRVGEKLDEPSGTGPAPAQMVAPGAFLFDFHGSLIVYVVPATSGFTVSTKAAFGEKVPAKPPLSFQASGCPAAVGYAPPLVIPRS